MYFEVAVCLAVVGYLLYKYGTRNFDRWSKAGITYIKPFPFLGNSWGMFSRRVSALEFGENLYSKLRDHRYGGTFIFRQPSLLIVDPELVRLVTIKDFDHFVNRNSFVDEEADPLFGKNLVSIKDQKWRDTRNILSPAFTSSKMKNMFNLINQCGLQMTEFVDQKIKKQTEENHKDGNILKMEFKDFFTRFTNDVIATAAFGIQVDSLREPKNEFYMMGKRVTSITGTVFVRFVLFMTCPWLMKKLGITFFGSGPNNFFRKLVHGTIKTREEKNIVRPDIIHLLMEAREGKLSEDGKKAGLSDDDITAQALLFFFAGFETISTFLGFAAHELAVNPDVQQRLQQEIDDVIEEDGGNLTYEGLMTKMKYLDMVVSEVLRLWPPGPFVDRRVTKRYVIPACDKDPGVVLEKDDLVSIPIGGFHLDPVYFPDPKKFDPERFSDENKGKILPFTYLPFGSGPRNCIGNRFALMEGKAGLVNILRKYTFTVIPETQIPLKLAKTSLQMRPEKGYWLGLKPRT